MCSEETNLHQHLYEILGVPHTATQKEIRASYLRLCKQCHPDLNPSPDATIWMEQLNTAYEVLGNPANRAAYDASLFEKGVYREKEEKTYQEEPEAPFSYAKPEHHAVSPKRYVLALILGGIATVVAGYIWYGITLALDAKWAVIALLVGAIPGSAVYFAAGRRKKMLVFGVMGAVAAGLGLLLGDYLIYEEVLSEIAYQQGVSLEFAMSLIPFSEYLHETTGVLDVVFYILAVMEGFGIGGGFVD